ncbi:MAG: lysophospholipid acyltransferase family protein, partial [Candidatus Eisenbacteria bacterium]
GVFVPFLGIPASTPVGPARMALALGAPIVMGFCWRRPDGRFEIDYEPALAGTGRGDDAVLRLTALHTDRLTAWVRRMPEMWFWLHRRWKTVPAP